MAIASHSSPPVSNPQPTFVYFISSGATPIKIGVSHDPIQRLAELQTAHYQKLSLLYAIECKERWQALELESAFHRWYDDVHIRNEWFNLNPKRIADDIRLLTTLAHSVVSATQHVATPELERMEARAEERISRRRAATGYSKQPNASEIARTHFQINPSTLWDDAVDLVALAATLEIGKSTMYSVRTKMRIETPKSDGAS